MKKVIIDNCVPLNNGDAALIFGLSNQLIKKGFSVEYSCLNYEEAKKIYPEYKWHKSHISNVLYKLCFKKNILVLLWKLIMFIKLVLMDNEYKKADVVISAPGGYIHSYYGIEGRMFILYLCKKWLKKSVGIYSQSIGNLNERDINIFYKYGKDLDFILVRDDLSYSRALSYGNFTNIQITKDAAFLLFEDKNKTEAPSSKSKKVAISLREWNKEGRDMKNYFNLINYIVDYLLKKNYEIVFLSTCQGIENYKDDSAVALDFIEQFNYSTNDKISVNSGYNKLEDLQSLIKDFDFVIGTRLHMCILSLINGVPAFNISYEEKGKECYKYLGIEEYSVDFNSGEFISKINSFFNMSKDEKNQILDTVKKVSSEQQLIFEKLAASNFKWDF